MDMSGKRLQEIGFVDEFVITLKQLHVPSARPVIV